MNRLILSALGIFSCISLASCSSGVDMPKGSSRGYSSARLIAKKPSLTPTPEQTVIHRMIQSSIATQFSSRGLAYNKAGADLIVAYLVVQQDNAMTTYFEDYYGSGGAAEDISDRAHEQSVIKGKRREAFERAGLVIDVIDAKTNKLVYRNYYVGDIVRGTSNAVRSQRVNAAVNEALSGFFR